jgi:hypothetical protein
MFCSECGQPARGKFCSHCGSPLAAPPAQASVVAFTKEASPTVAVVHSAPTAGTPDVSIDWENEISYEQIMRSSAVRQVIDTHARMAKKRMAGEQFLALAEKLIPQPVPMEDLAALAQPLWAKLGVRTGKSRSADIQAPVARVIVRVLCSLARSGQALRGVVQGSLGCTLEAELPSDMLALAGTLEVSIFRIPNGSRVNASTRIEGQLFDWGKSQRCLEKLLADLHLPDPLQAAA